MYTVVVFVYAFSVFPYYEYRLRGIFAFAGIRFRVCRARARIRIYVRNIVLTRDMAPK